VDEGRCDQHAGAEMSRQEERVVRHGEGREAADDDGEGAGQGGEDEDEEQGGDMEGSVVVAALITGAACRALAVGLSAGYLGVQGGEREVGPW